MPKNGEVEKPLVTAGQSVNNIIRFLPPGKNSYSARDVVKLLVGALREPHYVF